MTDIFISYARSTEAGARRVADALRALGYGVWRDDELPAHRAYAEVIEERLRAAKAVVVVWSAEAVKSQWVRAEANVAREAGTLVQLRIDDCVLPLPFNEIQCADLSGWSGGADAQGWRRVLESVDQLCGRAPTDRPPTVADATQRGLSEVLRKPAILGAIAAAALAVIVTVVVILTHPLANRSAAASNQRIAFFGYTVDGSDPSGGSTALARSATDRMFQTLRAFRLDTAAQTATLDTPRDKRFTRAAAVGARYAMSGEVRSERDRSVLVVRIEDVATQTTLWEQSFSGPLNEGAYLPAMAAWPTNQVLRCIASWNRTVNDRPQIIQLVSNLCRDGGYVRWDDRTFIETAAKIRDLVGAEPDSAEAHASLATILAFKASTVSPSARPPLIAEAESALSRARQLAPNDPQLDAEEALAEGRGLPLSDFDNVLRKLLPQLEKSNSFGFSQANLAYYELYAAAGRRRDALDAVTAMAANDPGNVAAVILPGFAYAVTGQSATARKQFEAGLASNPTAEAWSAWTIAAIFLGAGDPDAMLKSPPWFVPRPTVECLRDIRKASASSAPAARAMGARRAIECADRGDLGPGYAVMAPAALGEVDLTFARLEREPRLDSAMLKRLNTTGMFWPISRAVRADPRFLPLVERLGLMDYWRATRSQPDICETEDVPFCRELKKTVSARR